MTDHEKSARRQEQAALYALGALGDEDARALELELAGSASLKSDIEAFQEIATELAFSTQPIMPPASLKERLMTRLANEPRDEQPPSPFTFVRASALEWQDIGAGVSVKVLFFDPAGARVTTLMKMAPGSRFGAHRHAQVEEIYVIEGSCICAGQPLATGDYHRAESSSVHPETYSESGCLALIMSSSKNTPVERRR